MQPNSTQVARDIVRLRLRFLAKLRPFRKSRRAEKQLRSIMEKRLTSPEKRQVTEIFRSGQATRGALLIIYKLNERTGKVEPSVSLDLDPMDRAAIRWAKRTLRKHRKHFRSKLTFILNADLEELLDTLAECGLHINGLVLLGEPKTALRQMKRAYPKLARSKNPFPPGLRIRPATQPTDPEAVARLYRSEFSRSPQFCWYCASKPWLKLVREEIRAKAGDQFVIVDRIGKVLGHVPVGAKPHVAFGSMGGIGITLHRSIQGKGLAKAIYFFGLRKLVAAKARAFVGGTSQPGVMKLSTVMKRQILGYELQSGKAYFPRSHFRYPFPGNS